MKSSGGKEPNCHRRGGCHQHIHLLQGLQQLRVDNVPAMLGLDIVNRTQLLPHLAQLSDFGIEVRGAAAEMFLMHHPGIARKDRP